MLLAQDKSVPYLVVSYTYACKSQSQFRAPVSSYKSFNISNVGTSPSSPKTLQLPLLELHCQQHNLSSCPVVTFITSQKGLALLVDALNFGCHRDMDEKNKTVWKCSAMNCKARVQTNIRTSDIILRWETIQCPC